MNQRDQGMETPVTAAVMATAEHSESWRQRLRFDLSCLAAVLVVLGWSATRPYEWGTWWMEVTPALVGIFVLASIYPRFRFSRFVTVCIALHMMILLVGGHYTYARVPLFDTIRDWFGWTRNHYDRVGHFAQGFVPALIAREILLRRHVLARPRWVSFLVVCIGLAISATYELIEWSAALVLGSGADEFLGSQGDVWDTQEDMFMALLGAACALLLMVAVSRLRREPPQMEEPH